MVVIWPLGFVRTPRYMYTEPRMKNPGVSGLLLKQFSHTECEKTSRGRLWQSLVEFATSTRSKVGKQIKMIICSCCPSAA